MTTDRRDPLLPIKIAAHRALRYARWAWEGRTYARRRPPAHGTRTLLADSRSRLVRDPARAHLEMVAGKIQNLRLAAAALNGVVIRPGETLSFWYVVGEPSRRRGFQDGMELRSGCIVPSPGGGLCQIAGAIFEVALRVGLTIVEHHAHSLEIAPEHDRIRPFGVAAAVLYPYRDLRVRNDRHHAITVSARVDADALVVSASAPQASACVLDLEERVYELRRAGGRLVRAGQLWQVCRVRGSGEPVFERLVLEGAVEVMEDLPRSHCYTCAKACLNARVHAPGAARARVEAELSAAGRPA